MEPNILVTKRMLSSSLSLLLSGILGSVAGLLAAIGKAMSVSEESFSMVKKKMENKEKLSLIKGRRKWLRISEENEKKDTEENTMQKIELNGIKFI